MYRAMQCYMEGYRTFSHAVSMRDHPTIESAKTEAKAKARGIPFVTKGVQVVWSPLADKLAEGKVGHISNGRAL